jgi:hypothetical protein
MFSHHYSPAKMDGWNVAAKKHPGLAARCEELVADAYGSDLPCWVLA